MIFQLCRRQIKAATIKAEAHSSYAVFGVSFNFTNKFRASRKAIKNENFSGAARDEQAVPVQIVDHCFEPIHLRLRQASASNVFVAFFFFFEI